MRTQEATVFRVMLSCTWVLIIIYAKHVAQGEEKNQLELQEPRPTGGD